MANKPEDFCISFPTAKALQKKDIFVESYFSWVKARICGGISDWHIETTVDVIRYSKVYQIEYLPAPIADELLPLFPDYVDKNGETYYFDVGTETNAGITNVICQYISLDYESLFHAKKPTLREAFAKVLIELKEAGYELNEIN